LVLTSAAGFQAAFLATTERWGSCWRAVSLFATYSDLVEDVERRSRAVGTRQPPPFEELSVEHVSFGYGHSDDLVLRDVSLTVRRGEMVGLVGHNGAGKSTLVKLICGFYNPTSGRITWNGLDIRDLDIEAYRRELGAVFQDFMTYDLSLAENIGLGDVDRVDDRAGIVEAAAKVEADQIADDLPSGYDTLLSRVFEPDVEGVASSTLSGGQWQRVAIARALMREGRPLLLLDEPTSGMDPEREERLRRVVLARRHDQAVLCISHRLSSLRDCDRIIVLVNGSVAEEGRHGDLMDLAGGSYRAMFAAQAAGYADAGFASSPASVNGKPASS